METFNPKNHRIALNMYQQEMADYMGWSERKQRQIEAGQAKMRPADVEYMKKAKKMKKCAKKKRYPVDGGK